MSWDGSHFPHVQSNEHREEGHAVDLKNMSQEELIQLAKEKGIELTDEQLEALSGGEEHWYGDKNFYITHNSNDDGTPGCGKVFESTTRYVAYCPLCGGYINYTCP